MLHGRALELNASCIIETLYLLNSNFPPPPLAATILLSDSLSLSILDTLYTWNHAVFVLLWLAYFSEHNVLKVHPCYFI